MGRGRLPAQHPAGPGPGACPRPRPPPAPAQFPESNPVRSTHCSAAASPSNSPTQAQSSERQFQSSGIACAGWCFTPLVFLPLARADFRRHVARSSLCQHPSRQVTTERPPESPSLSLSLPRTLSAQAPSRASLSRRPFPHTHLTSEARGAPSHDSHHAMAARALSLALSLTPLPSRPSPT